MLVSTFGTNSSNDLLDAIEENNKMKSIFTRKLNEWMHDRILMHAPMVVRLTAIVELYE